MDTNAKTYTVSEAARLAHVTVRTLHHYDAIGLLVPSQRSASGYRLYTDADLRRLHQILLLRELGFSLDSIGRVLDDPSYDRADVVRGGGDPGERGAGGRVTCASRLSITFLLQWRCVARATALRTAVS